MMLSNRIFEEDPFFAGHREYMRQMNQMFATPFGFGTGGMLGIQDAQQQQQQRRQQRGHNTQVAQRQNQPVMPADLFGFGAFGGMFQNMRRMMDEMNNTFENAATDPNGQVFTQSSFMSYSNVGGAGAQPKVYQASTSTTQLPGGVRETRRMMRDSESGVEKIAVGHHIGERGHVVQRQRNRQTGMQEENREYINLDEEEAPEFDREWLEQSRQMYGHNAGRVLQHQRRHHPHQHHERSNRRALTAPGQRHSHRRSPSYRDRE